MSQPLAIDLCPHGCKIGEQGGVTQSDLDSWVGYPIDEAGLLEYYSACDCCAALMHHSTCGEGYKVMLDGRTLCLACVATEKPEDIDE